MDLSIFIAVFTVIFVAELPDKTAFATFLMATRGRPLAIFIGVAAAFAVQSMVAVIFGHFIALFPERWVHLGAGVLFLGFAAHTWFFHDTEEKEVEKETPKLSGRGFWQAVSKSFMVIFIAEWGDITQLATASLAAHYPKALPTVFVASTLALWLVTALAVIAGKKAGHVIHPRHLKNASVVIFIAIGGYFIATAF